MRKVWITGATGFCGRHLIERLRQEASLEITGLGRRAANAKALGLDAFLQIDLLDSARLAETIKSTRPDWIFHLAGLLGGNSEDTYRANLMSAVGLLEGVRAHAPEARVLVVGSAAEYGPSAVNADLPLTEETVCKPVGPYGISKYAQTLTALDYAARFNLAVNVARPFNIIGADMPSSLLVGALLKRAREATAQGRSSVTVGNVSARRDFVSARDVVDGYVRLMQSEIRGGVFNFSSGHDTPIREVVETVLSFFPQKLSYEVDSSMARAADPASIYGSYAKAKAAFGFQPRVSLSDALREAFEASRNV